MLPLVQVTRRTGCAPWLTPHTYANLRQILGGRPDDLAEHVTRFLLAGLRIDRS
jgi:hypothetical protein